MKIGIIGAGSFGTSIAFACSQNKHQKEIYLYDPDQEIVDDINQTHINSKIFPKLELAKNIKASKSLEEVVNGAELVLVAAPSQFLRKVYEDIKSLLDEKTFVVNLSKGFEKDTHKTSYQIFGEIFDNENDYATLSGPSFAYEIVKKDPTAITIATEKDEIVETVRKYLSSDFIRIYNNHDIIGTEICGVMKNVIAIASGCHEGIGLGWNSKAALVTRGLAEIARLVEKMGGKQQTVLGLSGLGDLILSATSKLSRNYQFGVLISQGKSVSESESEVKGIIEGINTARIVQKLAKKYQVEMPISQAVNEILDENKSVKKVIFELMSRRENVEL